MKITNQYEKSGQLLTFPKPNVQSREIEGNISWITFVFWYACYFEQKSAVGHSPTSPIHSLSPIVVRVTKNTVALYVLVYYVWFNWAAKWSRSDKFVNYNHIRTNIFIFILVRIPVIISRVEYFRRNKFDQAVINLVVDHRHRIRWPCIFAWCCGFLLGQNKNEVLVKPPAICWIRRK